MQVSTKDFSPTVIAPTDVYPSHVRRLEILAALCPKQTLKGKWRRGPFNVRYRFHTDASESGMGPRITATDIQDPHWGRFTNEGDRELVTDLVVMIAQRYSAYLASGSQAWSATLDMSALPEWLITAGKAGARAVFLDRDSPAPPPSGNAARSMGSFLSTANGSVDLKGSPKDAKIAPIANA